MYNSLCRVSTSVPFETVGVHPKTLPEYCFFLSSSSSDFLLVFVSRQCHHLHYYISPAKQINNYLFFIHTNVRSIPFSGPNNNKKDQTELNNIKGVLFLGAQLSYKTFSSSSENQENNNNNNNNHHHHHHNNNNNNNFIYSGKDTRLVEKIVWVRWSLKVFLSVTFHFPFSLNK